MASYYFLWRAILASILSLAVSGLASPIFASSVIGEKTDDFAGHSSSNESPILLLNRQPMRNWGDEASNGLQGSLKDKAGVPVLRLSSPHQISDPYYLPFPRKRGGKVILVDVVDYISKDKAQGDDGVPAVVLSGKGGGISGNMMRFSGK